MLRAVSRPGGLRVPSSSPGARTGARSTARSSSAPGRRVLDAEIVGWNPTRAAAVAVAQVGRAPGRDLGGCGIVPRRSPRSWRAAGRADDDLVAQRRGRQVASLEVARRFEARRASSRAEVAGPGNRAASMTQWRSGERGCLRSSRSGVRASPGSPPEPGTVPGSFRGSSSADRAFGSHPKGRGFESRLLHRRRQAPTQVLCPAGGSTRAERRCARW